MCYCFDRPRHFGKSRLIRYGQAKVNKICVNFSSKTGGVESWTVM